MQGKLTQMTTTSMWPMQGRDPSLSWIKSQSLMNQPIFQDHKPQIQREQGLPIEMCSRAQLNFGFLRITGIKQALLIIFEKRNGYDCDVVSTEKQSVRVMYGILFFYDFGVKNSVKSIFLL